MPDSWFHDFTADILDDHEPTPAKDIPTIRLYARFVVAALTLSLTTAYMIYGRVPLTQTTTIRRYDQEWILRHNYWKDNHGEVTCPCQNKDIDWQRVSRFVIVYRNGTRLRITSSMFQAFCDDVWPNDIYNSCLPLMKACSIMNADQTSLPLPVLLIPSILVRNLVANIRITCTNIQRYTKTYLYATSGTEDRHQELMVLSPLVRSFYAAFKGFLEDPKNRTDVYYWERPPLYYKGKSLPTLFNTSGLMIRVDMDYDAYISQCHPVFCDQRLVLALWYRVYIGMSQVGCILSIALFMVRCVWPMILYLVSNIHPSEHNPLTPGIHPPIGPLPTSLSMSISSRGFTPQLSMLNRLSSSPGPPTRASSSQKGPTLSSALIT